MGFLKQQEMKNKIGTSVMDSKMVESNFDSANVMGYGAKGGGQVKQGKFKKHANADAKHRPIKFKCETLNWLIDVQIVLGISLLSDTTAAILGVIGSLFHSSTPPFLYFTGAQLSLYHLLYMNLVCVVGLQKIFIMLSRLQFTEN